MIGKSPYDMVRVCITGDASISLSNLDYTEQETDLYYLIAAKQGL